MDDKPTPRKSGILTQFILRQWRLLVILAVLTVAASLVSAFQPWPIKLVVDTVSGPALPGASTQILIAASAGLLLCFVSSALTAAMSWTWSLVGQRMVYELSTQLFDRLLRVPLAYHHQHSAGDSLGRLSGDAWCIYSLTDRLFTPVSHVATIATIGVVAWQVNPKLTLISLVASPLLALSSMYFGKRMKSRSKLEREAESRVASFVHQTLAAMPLVQSFTSEDRNSQRFDILAAHASGIAQQRAVVSSAYGMVNGLVTTLGAVLVTYFGARQVIDGQLSVGSLVVFIAYVQTLQKAAEGLLKTYGDMKPLETSMERVLEVLHVQPGEPRDSPDVRPLRIGAAPGIALHNVTFGYDVQTPVLHDVSLGIPAGATVAFIGETGAGKSSLVSLIARFFDPASGRVTINGEDIRSFTIDSLREQISFVLQEPFLFPRSIADNIGFARPSAKREEIEAAARLARADAFIGRLPQGYDTILDQRGGSLSGGERQRIAIARAILKNAPILILDEPTSALDSATESGLLEGLCHGRTCLIIAHRLSTVRRADFICVLSQGRIVEQGTHDELLTARGTYHRLYSLQSGAAE